MEQSRTPLFIPSLLREGTQSFFQPSTTSHERAVPSFFLSFLSLLLSIVVRHRRDTVNRSQSSISSRTPAFARISEHTYTTDSNAVATRSIHRRSTILTLTILINIYAPNTKEREILLNNSFFRLHTTPATPQTRHSLIIRNICVRIRFDYSQTGRAIYMISLFFVSAWNSLRSYNFSAWNLSVGARSHTRIFHRCRDFSNHGLNNPRQNDQVAPGAERRWWSQFGQIDLF